MLKLSSRLDRGLPGCMALLALLATPQLVAYAEDTVVPSVSGPIAGTPVLGSPLFVFLDAEDTEAHEFVIREFFISGVADGQPYSTRMTVTGPADPNNASEQVIVEPQHSASGDTPVWSFTEEYVYREGIVWVGVLSQKRSLDNVIKPGNATRYASLDLPSNTQSPHILTQVGRLLKSDDPSNPLNAFYGNPADNLFLTGTSQTGGVVINQIRNFDGDRTLDGGPIWDGYMPTSTSGGQTPLPGRDVPIIQILTQSEVEGSPRHDYRRPDSDDPNDRFRLYEASGAPHNDLRDNPDTLGPDCTPKPVSRYPFEHVYQMALDNLIRWVDAGVAPPKAERIALNTDGTLDFDEFGNAQGGVRTSYLDVPIATYRVLGEGGGFCRLWGWEVAFSPEQLQQLYTNHEHYVRRVNAWLKELVDEGFYLEEDAQVIMDEAARADVP